jgi:hypothetical protein
LLLLICLIFSLLFVRCEKFSDYNSSSDGNVAYSYWVGEIPNSYYLFNIMGEKGLKITGKPFMVSKYNKVSLLILDCEIGLSEIMQAGIATLSGLNVPPEPTLDISSIDYKDKLGMKSLVDLLVTWSSTFYATKDTVNDFQNFYFQTKGGEPGVKYDEAWKFTYNNVTMIGGMKNIDLQYYFGSESDNNAFDLLKK